MPLTFLKNNRSFNQEGFTLIEVMMATVIMAISFGAILAVQGGAVRASIRAKEMATVTTLLRNQMIQTEYQIQGKTFEMVKKEDQGAFKAPYQDYSWQTSIHEITLPDLTPILNAAAGNATAQANGGASELVQTLGRTLTKFLSKALREVTVTVLWNRGGKPTSVSVSTYWVDLNYDFAQAATNAP